jgi:hypothetical protein
MRQGTTLIQHDFRAMEAEALNIERLLEGESLVAAENDLHKISQQGYTENRETE